jgi:hypothetical protein
MMTRREELEVKLLTALMRQDGEIWKRCRDGADKLIELDGAILPPDLLQRRNMPEAAE